MMFFGGSLDDKDHNSCKKDNMVATSVVHDGMFSPYCPNLPGKDLGGTEYSLLRPRLLRFDGGREWEGEAISSLAVLYAGEQFARLTPKPLGLLSERGRR